MLVRSAWKTILTTPRNRNRPTPRPTVKISSVPFITALTCSASTDRSGSATVISTPIRKQTDSRMPSFLDLVSPSPMYCPIGVMAMSAPRLKRLMPTISRTAATPNTASSVREISTQGVMESTKTSAVTGITEISDSLSFSRNDFHRSRKIELDLLFMAGRARQGNYNSRNLAALILVALSVMVSLILSSTLRSSICSTRRSTCFWS